ncbi:MAG: N-acetylmuramoyl-L-alanine amidase [Methylomonas sp.]|jgi:N-acetylmuramoyl-L-alanine amidase
MLRILKFFCVLIPYFWASSVCAEQALLTNVNYANQSGNHIVFQLSGAAHQRYFALTNPNRLVVDFYDTGLSHALAQPPAGHPLFLNLRSGQRNGKDLRLVIDLSSSAGVTGNIVKTDHGSELRIDMAATETAPKKIEKVVVPVNVTANMPAVRQKTSLIPTPEPAMAKPAKSQSFKPKGRDIIVAIDAGHGGKDIGAQGSNGTQEKDVVFAIAKRLETLVDHQPGMRAVMIRKGDYFVKLHERVHIAHEAKADLLVSIHADAFNDPSAHGASVYTLSNKGASSASARWLADTENAADNIGGPAMAERNEFLTSVLQDLSQSAAKEASHNVGSTVLKSVRLVGHLHRSAVQKAGFVVLKSSDIPSILVETAFISNPEEENRLNSNAYQEKMARALFGGISAHFRHYAPAGTLLAQQSKSKVRHLAMLDEGPDKAINGDAPSGKAQHVVNQGETLSGIAQQYGVSMRALRLANNMNDGNVKVGGVLFIPNNS